MGEAQSKMHQSLQERVLTLKYILRYGLHTQKERSAQLLYYGTQAMDPSPTSTILFP